ncbi:hypothetical protein CyaNS01_01300 [Cyanobium sp. NS01]|nr:hypothetical protein CyaNS01_01300 [Cyanobium sp. NS01]
MTGTTAVDLQGLTRWPGRARPKAQSASARLRRSNREDALRQIDLATLAQAFLSREAVYLGRGDFWRWELDGIPLWLVPQLRDLGFLP